MMTLEIHCSVVISSEMNPSPMHLDECKPFGDQERSNGEYKCIHLVYVIICPCHSHLHYNLPIGLKGKCEWVCVSGAHVLLIPATVNAYLLQNKSAGT